MLNEFYRFFIVYNYSNKYNGKNVYMFIVIVKIDHLIAIQDLLIKVFIKVVNKRQKNAQNMWSKDLVPKKTLSVIESPTTDTF